MKKFIIITGIIMSMLSATYAYSYDENYKKEFYDNLINGLFSSLQQSMLSNGHSKEKTDEYLKIMKTRLNRTELENKTWGCVSQHSMDEMTHNSAIINECFGDWSSSFIYGNADAMEILQR